MKKLILLLIVLFVIPFASINVKAEELDDSTITKLDYYPSGSLSSKRELILKWTSSKQMDDLSIKVYLPSLDDYAEIYNMNWDEENPNEYEAKFEILKEQVDDELTPDIDESLEGDWEYRITFVYSENSLSIMKIVFDYNAGETNYFNILYLPNVVYPQIKPGNDDNNQNGDDDKIDDSFTTKNALFAAVFAAVCSVIGTVLIILSSSKKLIEDDEDIIE